VTTLLRRIFLFSCAGSLLTPLVCFVGAADETSPELRALQEQNRRLQQQVESQQKQIDELRARLDRLQGEAAAPAAPAPRVPATEPAATALPVEPAERGGTVRLSGEAGFAFFRTAEDGAYPNSEFRVDDAKLFIEAKVWQNTYLFGGLELTTREANDEYFHVGELYADVERLAVSGRQAVLNLRVGRFYIPFGEEYQARNMLDNPLISHSVADLWGIDEGVQVYGSLGRVRYNLAVQNGGHKALHDFNSDKSVVARLSLDATPQLHLSASAMRTGKLDVAGDGLSEIWLANAFFRALGTAANTKRFWAEIAEIDAAWRWKNGQLRGTAGWIDFDDDSTAGDNSRHMTYYSLETRQELVGNLFGAVRYSRLRAPRGYPIVGQGSAGEYFYNPFAPRTTELHRFSLGLGYRFGPPLVWKLEYNWEDGRLINGTARENTGLLSTELAMRF
jgi:hypothetical protein